MEKPSMKFALHITDATPDELTTLLAKLGASTAVVVSRVIDATAEDDDNADTTSDVAVAPGTLDSTNLPWDERIHSKPAALTDKGVWRAKRGVGKDKAFVASVEAELRARAVAAAPVFNLNHTHAVTDPGHAVTYPAPVTTQPVFDPNAAFGGAHPVHPQPVAAPVYQPPAPQPVAQPVAGQYDFNGFMSKVQQLLQQRDAAGAPLIDAGYLNNVSVRVGQAWQQPVNAITDLMPNQAMIDYAIQVMFSEGKWA
jgi:hypothetical protein